MSIAKAEIEMRELQEKVEVYQNFIGNAEARIADLGTYIRIAGELGEDGVSDFREAVSRAAVSRESSRSGEDNKVTRARNLAVEAITKAGHAILTRDMVELLAPHGLTFGYGDPKKATGDLSGILGRERRLHNAGRSVGWVLKNWGEAHSASEAAKVHQFPAEAPRLSSSDVSPQQDYLHDDPTASARGTESEVANVNDVAVPDNPQTFVPRDDESIRSPSNRGAIVVADDIPA